MMCLLLLLQCCCSELLIDYSPGQAKFIRDYFHGIYH